MLVCDHIVERLVREGVRHVFGVGGANIEDMFAAVQRRRPIVQAILSKHEHAAGTAADAYARIQGFGVVMTTSGGGAMNLVHALAEGRASEVPMLAIIGEPPRSLQGRGAFQDTSGKADTVDALAVFRAVTRGAARIEHASELGAALERALDVARTAPQGPSVILLAKDLQREEIAEAVRTPKERSLDSANSTGSDLERAEKWLASRPIVIIAGPDVPRAGACELLAVLAGELDATVTTTPDARDAFDNAHPRFLGVCGAMGHSPVARALETAEVVVVAGTTLPILARQGLEATLGRKRLLSLGHAQPFVQGAESLHIAGAVSEVLRELIDRRAATIDGPTTHSVAKPAATAAGSLARFSTPSFRTAAVMEAVARLIPETSTVLVDAGNTGASASHCVRAPRGGRWLIAMGMAGMGYTFGAATGAACATKRRCFVLAGDGAFYMHGMEIHTAVEHSLPITYVIFDNRAHGMCLVRERLLLGENAGYNTFGPARIGAGLAAMFPGLRATDCETVEDVEAALSASLALTGPSVISVVQDDVEVPPFSLFQERAPEVRTVTREADDVPETRRTV
jgi:acetolactate synthase-1/2/3 large subunit